MPTSTPRLRSTPPQPDHVGPDGGGEAGADAPEDRALPGAGAADHQGVPTPQPQPPVPTALGPTQPNRLGDREGRGLGGVGRGDEVVAHHQVDHDRAPRRRTRDGPDPVRDRGEGGGQPLGTGLQLGQGLPRAGPDGQTTAGAHGSGPGATGERPSGTPRAALRARHAGSGEPAGRTDRTPARAEPAATGEPPPAHPAGRTSGQPVVGARRETGPAAPDQAGAEPDPDEQQERTGGVADQPCRHRQDQPDGEPAAVPM